MVKYEITRTFHPVGQGAFYSERHNDFNIVYDCGAMPLSGYTKSVVRNAFSAHEDIDVLFISHFDYDHVSAISTLLKSVRSIKRVVLPLLDESTTVLLTNINRALSHNILKLIGDPELFFGKNTQIIYVAQSSNEDSEAIDPINLDLRELPKGSKQNRIIKSGTNLNIGGSMDWVCVPYNYLNKERKVTVITGLNNAGFNVLALQSDAAYTLHKITTASERRKLRATYTQLDGNINENSMLLYSGPRGKTDDELFHVCDPECSCSISEYCKYCYLVYKVGCIFTGDSDFNKIELSDIYSEFMDFVGIIQIPHHGSKNSFSIDMLRDFKWSVFCPVSYGTKNRYGHPAAEVINQLSRLGHKAILVNEQPDSNFKQTIKVLSKGYLMVQQAIRSF